MKKLTAWLLTLALLVSMAAFACADEKLELVMWGGWSGDSIAQFTEMLDAYNA